MAFYGERNKSEEDDCIWLELKYWLENPITKGEQAERDNEINNYIDAILKKAFGD